MSRAKVIRAAVTLPLAAAALAGCGGGGKSYANDPRPAAPIVITAAITAQGVNVSPTQFGAGLIQLVVVNLTNRSQQLSLVAKNGGSFHQQTGPINPQGTDQLKADVRPGTYMVHVRAGGAVLPATIIVGRQRASAQDQLLQP